MSKFHCPVIHGALVLDMKKIDYDGLAVRSCCLRKENTTPVKLGDDIMRHPSLAPLRQFNKKDIEFDPLCWNCESVEKAGHQSFRTGMLTKYGEKYDYSGPTRLDILFDVSCNLACRHCSPELSTLWQKHYKDNNIPLPPRIPTADFNAEELLAHIETMDLSNLGETVFCGGEPMLGRSYWRIAEGLADIVPNAKNQLTLQFQTNGTIPLTERNYETMEKFQLVKFLISVDGVGDQFEYLRWPAKWEQWTENILKIREQCPTNVMFLFEETLSVYNLFYTSKLDKWLSENFSTNRLGDHANHSKHTATGIFNLSNMTEEYKQAVQGTNLANFINPTWQENPEQIKKMIAEINKFDQTRNEDWTKTFPEVAEFYSRYM